ncbi:MAG: hypothetical protein IPK83_16975 [Planctomycetes bacterium]|nr:hypothetical protein [Planctomycetota bacterium]
MDHVAPNRIPKNTPYDTHPFIASRPLNKIPGFEEAFKERLSQLRVQKARKKSRQVAGLMSRAMELLERAADHPYTPIIRLWEMIKESNWLKQEAALKELSGQGLLEIDECRFGKTQMLLGKLTEQGWSLLNRKLPLPYSGGGGIMHNHMAHFIQRVGLARGFKSSIEYPVPEPHTALTLRGLRAWDCGPSRWL